MVENGFVRLAGPGGGVGWWGPVLGLAGTGQHPRRVVGLFSCMGGGGTLHWFSWWPGCVPGVFVVPGWCLQPCPAAPAMCACRPLPLLLAFPPCPVRATAPCSLPLSGAELAPPHLGVVPQPLLASGVPKVGWCVGDVGASSVWRESVLPGWLVALGCVSVVVGVSSSEGAGGVPVCCPGCAVGPSL